MKKLDKTTVLLVLILVAGLSLLLYPTIADWWNSYHQSYAISGYDDALEQMDEADYTAMFEAADAYNAALNALRSPFLEYEEVPGYNEALNITGDGLIGYLNIPKIKVKIPVYHGTDEGVLQEAAGHLEGSSLPTGEPGTHSAISAHRGLPSAKLFTDLDKLEIGDTFTFTVGDRVMTYQVDQIKVVLPYDVTPLQAEEGKDMCTLVTCTPYGINSHRLLVRGVRVDGTALQEQRLTSDAVTVEPLGVACVLTAIFVIVGVVGILVYDKLRSSARKRKTD